MNTNEVLKLALRSLKELVPDDSDHAPAIQGQRKRQENALKALQEALAQPQQEPVACKDCGAVIKDGVAKCVRGRSCWVGQQPAQEQYAALEQAPTRLQKRYGELEARLAANQTTEESSEVQQAPVQDIGVEQDERVFARIEARKNRDAAHKETTQRPWVGLTDVNAVELWQLARHDIVEFARVIEAAHSIKENT